MGGDGGVIASDRRYMRGAGTADHTADASRGSTEVSAKQMVQELMTLCYLTKNPLNFKDNQVVADPYGRLYHKEAVVEALLRRKQSSGSKDELGGHIRGLKDLHALRFSLSGTNTPICPVTGVDLNGINAAIFVYDKEENANVISERAIKELGKDALKEEYGQMERLLRLAPPPAMLEAIVKEVSEKHESELKERAGKKGKKKRKNREVANGEDDGRNANKTKSRSGLGDAARRRVQSAVKSNDTLSSLLATETKKESAANLFAR